MSGAGRVKRAYASAGLDVSRSTPAPWCNAGSARGYRMTSGPIRLPTASTRLVAVPPPTIACGTSRAVEVVPLPQRCFLTVDEQQALAPEHQKSLLIALAVIHRHRLTRLEHREIDAELWEPLAMLVELT